ncbi:MAG: hypothetical protein R3B09_28435 [Nannocystaceae bacterium]
MLGKAYLAVTLGLLVLGLLWASLTMQENAAWVEVVLWVPRMGADLMVKRRYEVNVAALMMGWAIAGAAGAIMAIRAPFKIRAAAIAQRRLRELEREVLELRTLPLRQQEEDEILAAEAHIEAGSKKVMTEKMRSEARAPGGRGLAP